MDLTKMKGKRYAGVNVHDNTGGGWNVCVWGGGGGGGVKNLGTYVWSLCFSSAVLYAPPECFFVLC